MKIACFADLHLGIFHDFSTIIQVYWNTETKKYENWGQPYYYNNEFKPFTGENARCLALNSRLVMSINCMAEARDALLKRGYKTMLFCGDLFHNRAKLSVDVIIAALNLFQSYKDCGINIIAIAANHDQTDNTIFGMSSLSILSHCMTVIETPTITEVYDGDTSFMLTAIPYCKDKEKVQNWIDNSPKDSILIAHLGINGATSYYGELGGEFSVMDLRPKNFKAVFLGHYHEPQFLAPNVCYCGATIQQSFADEIAESKRNHIVLYDTESCTYDYMYVNAPRFITTNDPSKITEGNFYRVRTNKSLEELEPLIDKNLLNVRIEQEKDYEISLDSEISATNTVQESIRIWARENNINEKVGEFIYNNKDADPETVGGIS